VDDFQNRNLLKGIMVLLSAIKSNANYKNIAPKIIKYRIKKQLFSPYDAFLSFYDEILTHVWNALFFCAHDDVLIDGDDAWYGCAAR
jgi:hypothetical protein